MYKGKRPGRRMRRGACVLILAAFTASSTLLCGCDAAKKVPVVGKVLEKVSGIGKIADKIGIGGDYVFRVNNQKCSPKEAKIALLNFQKEYKNLYGIDLWAHDYGEGESLEDYVKTLAISQLARVYTLDVIAGEMDVALSDEEQEKAAQAAGEYFGALSPEEVSYLDAGEEDVQALYERYALAQKLYTRLTEDIETEVSDDEARVMQAKQIYTTDEEKAGELLKQLQDGGDFDTVAASGNEASAVDVNIDRSMFGEEAGAQIFALQDGQTSGVIAAGGGYYIISCVKAYVPELTEANKANVLERRMSESVEGTYAAYAEKTGSSLEEENWDAIRVDTSLKLEGSSFLEIYEKYFPLP